MIIQPLVENSIIHGFKNKQRNCQIDISINRKNDMLSIEVKDNGKGLSQEQIDQFMKHEASDFIEGQKDRIGLGNVIRRLRLFFGVEYVLWISSQPDIETCFELRLPIDASSET
jgi:sensor histidine kinase YesM